MASHSSVLAWRIPGTGKPGGLPSMGSHRVGHDWSDLAVAAVNRTDEIISVTKLSVVIWNQNINFSWLTGEKITQRLVSVFYIRFFPAVSLSRNRITNQKESDDPDSTDHHLLCPSVLGSLSSWPCWFFTAVLWGGSVTTTPHWPSSTACKWWSSG